MIANAENARMCVTGQAVVQFSGGATSGYMLHEILRAHGGTLPADVVVLFQNTGREHPATLDFVQQCAARWAVPVTWLEYDRDARGPIARVVSHNSASRAGEPFAAMLAAKKMLPNPVSRFCTIELKIRTAKRHIVSEFGWRRWTNVVGLRADEPRRVERATDPARNKKDRWDVRCPLAEAGITVADVAAFWRHQPSGWNCPASGPATATAAI
jgi:3'-phosphoadenosine 5'-phosphosulfate sulfotransferase (PAPS reductase)/FAD synthetase